MSAWTDQYVGQPYVKDELDCGGWVERIMRERFGREVALPRERAQGLRPRSAQIAERIGDFCRPTLAPTEGDVVLMRCRGTLWHVGLYVVQDEPRVLHAMEGRAGQVQLHRIRDLARVGIVLEGYYTWI